MTTGYLIHQDGEIDVVYHSKEEALERFYGLLSKDEVENLEEVEAGEDLPYGYDKYGSFTYIAEVEIHE